MTHNILANANYVFAIAQIPHDEWKQIVSYQRFIFIIESRFCKNQKFTIYVFLSRKSFD